MRFIANLATNYVKNSFFNFNLIIMKKLNLFIGLLSILMFSLVIVSCEEDDNNNEPDNNNNSVALPERFTVDIPNSLSKANMKKNLLNIKEDTLQGDLIYENLTTFIGVGEASTQAIENLLTVIAVFNLNQDMDFEYTSDDDGRQKHLVLTENASFNGKNYQFRMNITDLESENNADGGMALQMFWSLSPLNGIAILKPYNIDRINDANIPDALLEVAYSEEEANSYEAEMLVTITGLPVDQSDPYMIDKLKMFVGKNGDIIDIYGNSNHPNARFISENTGYNWAFAAAGHETKDIGVAEIGLPLSSINSSDRAVLLEENSIKNVFSNEIKTIWPNANQEFLDAYLTNADAPGFFDANGFIQGGASPGTDWDELADRIKDLSPFNPVDVAAAEINFAN